MLPEECFSTDFSSFFFGRNLCSLSFVFFQATQPLADGQLQKPLEKDALHVSLKDWQIKENKATKHNEDGVGETGWCCQGGFEMIWKDVLYLICRLIFDGQVAIVHVECWFQSTGVWHVFLQKANLLELFFYIFKIKIIISIFWLYSILDVRGKLWEEPPGVFKKGKCFDKGRQVLLLKGMVKNALYVFWMCKLYWLWYWFLVIDYGLFLVVFVLDFCFFPYWFLGPESQLQILILKVP